MDTIHTRFAEQAKEMKGKGTKGRSIPSSLVGPLNDGDGSSEDERKEHWDANTPKVRAVQAKSAINAVMVEA